MQDYVIVICKDFILQITCSNVFRSHLLTCLNLVQILNLVYRWHWLACVFLLVYRGVRLTKPNP